MKRRNFIKGAGTALAGSMFLGPEIIAAPRRFSANDKLNIGVIGCNGMGWSNTNSILKMNDVDLLGICDVDNNVIKKRMTDYAALRKNIPKTYSDYRTLLNNKDIDAVIIGTPDHWHCKIMVDAVKAGKHVYVEKPVANSIAECNLMVSAQEKTGKIVQAGQWQRSGPHYKKAIDIVRSGVLGKIRLVKVWAYQGWMKPVPIVPDAAVPAGVDYNFWLGPAPKRNFNANRFHFNFRWFWDYAGGLMTDWGVHEIDIALYAMEAEAPISAMATGGKLAYPDDASETPDTLQAIFQYKDFNMLWEHATGIDNGPYNRREGIAFIGNNGTLVVDRGGYEVITERQADGYSNWGKGKMDPIEAYVKPNELNYLDLHTQNFVEAVKKNDQSFLNTPIRSGSVAAINAQM
jgi:predicted dehydrogenase